MGTRAILVFEDSLTVERLYQHSDGYPTSVLEDLDKTVVALSCLKAEYLAKWGGNEFGGSASLGAAMAGVYIGQSTTVYGMAARLEATVMRQATAEEIYGDAGDLEWIYVCNPYDRTIKVYGGGYTGLGPEVTVSKGTVDPTVYVKCLREECQESERLEIEASVKAITDLGWTINPTEV